MNLKTFFLLFIFCLGIVILMGSIIILFGIPSIGLLPIPSLAWLLAPLSIIFVVVSMILLNKEGSGKK